MVRCGFNHWLGWMSSTTKWPPWRRGAVSLNRDRLAITPLCAQSPLFSQARSTFILGSDGPLSRLILTLAHLLRGKMLSRNLPSMNTSPLFSNYNAFRSSSSHAWLYTMPFECVHNGGVLEAVIKSNVIVWRTLCLAPKYNNLKRDKNKI